MQRRQPATPERAGRTVHAAGSELRSAGKPASHGALPANLAALKVLRELPGSASLPASPAVAIWDRQGRLAYFGPYSEGAVCNSSNSFIEPILKALLEDRNVSASNTVAVGCYCAWAG